MAREAYEELLIAMGLPKPKITDIQKSGLVQVGKGGGTFVALMEIRGNWSRAVVNKQMTKNAQNYNLPYSYRETVGVELVPLKAILSLESTRDAKVQNTPNYRGVIRQITITKFLIETVQAFNKHGYFGRPKKYRQAHKDQEYQIDWSTMTLITSPRQQMVWNDPLYMDRNKKKEDVNIFW
jgi:hypothetical protein